MSNTDTITKFFSVFTPPASTNPNYLNLPYLMGLFTTVNAPNVGIASAAGSPQFSGVPAVHTLFERLFKCFPNISYGPVTGTPYCYSSSDGQTIQGNTITVQTILTTGVMAERWFSAVSPAYSKPLSDIEIDPSGRANSQNRPACAVFTFDPTTNNLILNLAIYFDRWQMAVDLWPGKPSGVSIHAFPAP